MSRSPQLWKDAVSVILAARNNGAKVAPLVKSCHVANNQESPANTADRDAVESTGTTTGDSFDYDILMLGRSGKSKFMPNAYVFPGGQIHAEDFSQKWSDKFASALGLKSVNQDSLPQLRLPMADPGKPVSELYTKKYEYDSNLPAEIGLRICGIRETFEESGILLYTDKASLQKGRSSNASTKTKVPKHIFSSWQKEVNHNEEKFIAMCDDLDILPDIWALNDWSNWLTPVNLESNLVSGRRFDTQFFLACMPDQVQEVHDDKEIKSATWINPANALLQFCDGEFNLAPPQVYEIARLLDHPCIERLEAHACQRAALGHARWMPVRVKHQDGTLAVLPGDDDYPSEPDWLGMNDYPKRDCTMEEAVLQTKAHNRFLITKYFSCRVLCDIENPHGHVNPSKGLQKLLGQEDVKLSSLMYKTLL